MKVRYNIVSFYPCEREVYFDKNYSTQREIYFKNYFNEREIFFKKLLKLARNLLPKNYFNQREIYFKTYFGCEKITLLFQCTFEW